MPDRERRQPAPASGASLRAQLNQEQLITLRDLERFGWELKFVRRPPFMESIPVVFDPDRKAFAVIRPDGEIDTDPGFDIRG
jgi:hypothetical protein